MKDIIEEDSACLIVNIKVPNDIFNIYTKTWKSVYLVVITSGKCNNDLLLDIKIHFYASVNRIWMFFTGIFLLKYLEIMHWIFYLTVLVAPLKALYLGHLFMVQFFLPLCSFTAAFFVCLINMPNIKTSIVFKFILFILDIIMVIPVKCSLGEEEPTYFFLLLTYSKDYNNI